MTSPINHPTQVHASGTIKKSRVIVVGTLGVIALIITTFGAWRLYQDSTNGKISSAKSIVPTKPASFLSCIPSGVALADTLDSRFGPSGTVESRLQALNASCKDNLLVDAKGKDVVFFQPGDCQGIGANSSRTSSSIYLYLMRYNLPAKLPLCQ
jgi:hypothetical protein